LPLTLPAVPTGMKAGVSMTPWAVWRRPARARVVGSRAMISNFKAFRPSRLSTFDSSTIRLLFDYPSIANPILISTRTIHNPKKHQNNDRLLAFRCVASEKPIASRAMNQKVKMSKEPARDIRGFDVSGPRKNPALLGTGL